MLYDFLYEDISVNSLQAFLESIYEESEINIVQYKSLSNLVLVHEETDYSFSSDDLSWLDYSKDVYWCKTELDYDVICINVSCFSEEYYTVCAALIKIFNKAFLKNVLFIFKMDFGIAFGSKRSLNKEVNGNFCVTELFDYLNEMDLQDFLYGLPMSEINELPLQIADYSPQETADLVDKYDKPRLNNDYIQFLQDFSETYGIDTTKEYDQYIDSVENQHKSTTIYQEVKDSLNNIAEEHEKSSYELLDEAIAAENKYTKLQKDFENTNNTIETESYHQNLSEEAYLKADVMLDEMMKL